MTTQSSETKEDKPFIKGTGSDTRVTATSLQREDLTEALFSLLTRAISTMMPQKDSQSKEKLKGEVEELELVISVKVKRVELGESNGTR